MMIQMALVRARAAYLLQLYQQANLRQLLLKLKVWFYQKVCLNLIQYFQS